MNTETPIASSPRTGRRQLLSNTAAVAAGIATGLAVGRASATEPSAAPTVAGGPYAVTHTDAEWRAMLSPEAYDVLREGGTEMPFSSPLDRLFKAGTYHCVGCSQPLYASQTKFDSGTGWPSFYQALPGRIATRTDTSFFMQRTEVHCSRCGGHLGHLFDDGPHPTGLRYCMDGVALHFVPA